MSDQKRKQSLEIKNIDSFLIVIKRDSSGYPSSSSSSNNKSAQASIILQRQCVFEAPQSKQVPLPLEPQERFTKSMKIIQKRSQILQNIQKCQQMRLKYEQLIKNSPKNQRASSSDRNARQHFTKKEEVRYLDYTESTRKLNELKSNMSNSLQARSIEQNSKYPQLRIQPYLLSIYCRDSCRNFYLLKLISKGPKFNLFLSQQLNSKLTFSLKMFKKQLFTPNDITKFSKQLKMQSFFNHPNIIKLYHFLNDNHFVYVLYEPCMHQDLATKLKQNGPMMEKDVRWIVRQIGAAIQYLHKMDLLHLKIRLENIYLQEDVVKVSAFDQAVHLPLLRKERMASQQIKVMTTTEKIPIFDTKTDIWDIGILTYELLFGKLPIFVSPSQPYSLHIHFPQEVSCSQLLKDFIEGCLQQNPFKRFSLRQMNEHAFLRGGDSYRWTMM